MAETKDRRKTPRKAATATPKPDTATTKTAAAPRKPASEQRSAAPMTGEEAKRLIAEAAYYRAARRNFAPGHELEDWIQAESEVMQRLNGAAH